MFVCPPNSCVETLIPSLMVFGDEDFGRQLGHEGGTLDGTREFLRRDVSEFTSPLVSLRYEDMTSRWYILQTRRNPPPDTRCLDFGFPSLQNCEK